MLISVTLLKGPKMLLECLSAMIGNSLYNNMVGSGKEQFPQIRGPYAISGYSVIKQIYQSETSS